MNFLIYLFKSIINEIVLFFELIMWRIFLSDFEFIEMKKWSITNNVCFPLSQSLFCLTPYCPFIHIHAHFPSHTHFPSYVLQHCSFSQTLSLSLSHTHTNTLTYYKEVRIKNALSHKTTIKGWTLACKVYIGFGEQEPIL